jgi:hypothetical protein
MLAKKLDAHGIQIDAPLLASVLGVVVPAAVVKAIVSSATMPARGSFAFPAAVSHIVHATAVSSINRWAKSAAIAVAVVACSSAVGSIRLPGLSQLPKLQNIKVVEWFQQWLGTNVKPRLSPNLPIRLSQNNASSSQHPTSLTAGEPLAINTDLSAAFPTPPTPTPSPVNFLRTSYDSLAAYTSLDFGVANAAELSNPSPVTIASPVPEPTFAALVLAGAFLIRRQRKVK